MVIAVDQLSQDYLALAFALDRHIPGFIDAYVGPAELRAELEASSPTTPQAIRERAQALVAQVAAADIPESRKAFLTVQTQAMLALSEKLSGTELGFTEEVERCFDVIAQKTPESLFEDAIAQLDAVLPGTGSVAERMAQWRQQFLVAPETAERLLDVIVPEIRRRTRELVDLPAGESVEFALVSDKPWSGYNWFLGNSRSRVEINTDLPIYANALTDLVCHEAYPGHHTEHSLKEVNLFRGEGWGEFSVQLIASPEAVISEGIATLASEIVFEGNELFQWQAEVLYPAAGLTGDPEREARIGAAQRPLRALNANAAYLRYVEGRPESEILTYVMRYGLVGEAEARHRLRFITDPLWRAYTFTYHSGRDLLEQWITLTGEENRRERFARLLAEPATPSGLQADIDLATAL